MVRASFLRIYLCGSSKVGKTIVSRTLSQGSRSSSEATTQLVDLVTLSQGTFLQRIFGFFVKDTRWIEVARSSSEATTKLANFVTLVPWDMPAGQHDCHLVHSAFFPTLSFSEGIPSTFVIFFSSKNLNEAQQQLEYWLRYIASSYPKTTERPHLFVVPNRMKEDKQLRRYGIDSDMFLWDMLLRRERDKFRGVVNVHSYPFIVDVSRIDQVNALKNSLLEHAQNLLKDVWVPEMCQNIQRNLTIWCEGKVFPVREWEEYVEVLRDLGVTGPEKAIDAATKYLNEAGVLICVELNDPCKYPYRKLVVLDPNWFFKEVLGNIFLSEDIPNHGERFRSGRHVGETGWTSIDNFRSFFNYEWNAQDFEQLIAILCFLGLCYKGYHPKHPEDLDYMFIPSLIESDYKPPAPWQPLSECEQREDGWVMGFSIEPEKNDTTFAPISLWHRFQVELGQNREFNRKYSTFVAGKYFMTFTTDGMDVMIQVDANEDIRTTFDEISIFVQPGIEVQYYYLPKRSKQRQVDLADKLLDILTGLWDDRCGGVEYVKKVVWPWPAFQSRPKYIPYRTVAQVKNSVQMHGVGRKIQLAVSNDFALTEDQLLSTRDKEIVIKAAECEAEKDCSVLKGVSDLIEVGTPPINVAVSDEEAIVGSQGFVFEVQKAEASCFLVSAEWLLSLGEHDKEILFSVLWRAGYSEVYHTGTTIAYERLDFDNLDISNRKLCSDALSTSAKDDVITVEFAKHVEASKGASDLLEMEKNDVEDYEQDVPSSSTFIEPRIISEAPTSRTKFSEEEARSSVMGTDRKANQDSEVTILEKGKKQLKEQQSTGLRSFIAALKGNGRRSYYVSTEWLSSLEDDEKEMLKSVCTETRTIETAKTSSTTCFERMEDQVHSIRNCNDGSNKDAGSDVQTTGASAKESEASQKRSDLLSTGTQDLKLLEGDVMPGSVGVTLGVTTETQPRLKSEDECVSQRLSVTCTSPSQSSTVSSTFPEIPSFGKRYVTQWYGDSYVTLPKQDDDHNISTRVEKILPMKIFHFEGKSEVIEDDVLLKVVVESTVSCCWKRAVDPKKVHLKFSKIRGEIEYVNRAKLWNYGPIFVQAVRSNVEACIGSENLDLGLDEANYPRVVDKVLVKIFDKVVDRVCLAHSLKKPNRSGPASVTVELRCDVPITKIVECVDSDRILEFKNHKSPVTLEGVCRGPLSHPSSLELDIRYQLQLSSIRLYESLPNMANPWRRTVEEITVVDFDCVLEYQVNDLS